MTFDSYYVDPHWVSGDKTLDMTAHHRYGQPGDYSVAVTVVNRAGQSALSNLTKNVTATPRPVDPARVPASQVIQWTDGARHIYGKTVWMYATGGGSGNPVTFTASPAGVCTTSGANGMGIRLVGVGQCTVTANQAGSAAYQAASGISETFTVEKAILDITPNPVTKASGAPNPVFTATYYGLVNGDTPQVVSGVVLSGPPADAPPGRYQITVSGGSSPNYTISRSWGKMTVNPVFKLAQHGLPTGTIGGLLWFDGHWVNTLPSDDLGVTPFTREVPYGSSLSYGFTKLMWDTDKKNLYITTVRDYNRAAQADVTVTARYVTIPGLLRQIGWGGTLRCSAYHDSLIRMWDTAQALWVSPEPARQAIRTFANAVRPEVGGCIVVGGEELLQYVQVVWANAGGYGAV